MTRELDVYWKEALVGKLVQNDAGRLIFTYSQHWLDQRNAFPLSQSLPLRTEPFRGKECHGFFGGILPEEHKREIIAKKLGISAKNDFAMLERIGGECAGAITFLPPGEVPSAHENKYKEISDKELVDILQELPKRPLMVGEEGVRLSLAGVQDKLAIVWTDKILLPLESSLSTHIIKPDHPLVPNLIYNEAYCLKLAERVGLHVAKGTLRKVNDISYLAVERYDRIYDRQGQLQRVHQEDFCQALGFASEFKYQTEGGPSLKACFELIRRVSSVPVLDIRALLDAVIFNFLIGNNDAHGKNYSLLYTPLASTIETRLAPLYDLISTIAYPEFSDAMAMSIAKKYRAEEIYPVHWEQFAGEVGLSAPMVKKRVIEMAEKITHLVEEPAHCTIEIVLLAIKKRCQQTLERFDLR